MRADQLCPALGNFRLRRRRERIASSLSCLADGLEREYVPTRGAVHYPAWHPRKPVYIRRGIAAIPPLAIRVLRTLCHRGKPKGFVCREQYTVLGSAGRGNPYEVTVFPTPTVLVQPEMEKRRSPLVSIPPFGGDFQGMGAFDPMEVGRRKNELSRPVHRLDEPTGISLGMVGSPQCPLPFRPAKSS